MSGSFWDWDTGKESSIEYKVLYTLAHVSQKLTFNQFQKLLAT